jgi:hypothetical protein
MASGKRLFSSIVVMGASLTGGCGGATDGRVGTADPGGDPAGTGGAAALDGAATSMPRADPRKPEDCADPAEFRCVDYATPTGCRCDESALLLGQCSSPRLQCSCRAVGGNYGVRACSPATRGDWAMECTCADAGPLSETDCASTTQFSCVDWNPRTTCICDPSAPRTQADCPTGEYLQCISLEPPVGCHCLVGIR